MDEKGNGRTNSLEDLKKSEEAKAARRADLLFKAESRRNKLLGLWAAKRMGHADPAAYAAEIVALVFVTPGIENIHKKLHADLDAAGTPVALPEIAHKSQELFLVAEKQIAEEFGGSVA